MDTRIGRQRYAGRGLRPMQATVGAAGLLGVLFLAAPAAAHTDVVQHAAVVSPAQPPVPPGPPVPPPMEQPGQVRPGTVQPLQPAAPISPDPNDQAIHQDIM